MSGVRQEKSRKASPEKRVSATKAGSEARARAPTTHGESAQSRAALLTRAMAFCAMPKVRRTSESGRVEASRRARVRRS